jgi:hypothetical protein
LRDFDDNLLVISEAAASMYEHNPENNPWRKYDVLQKQDSDDDPLVFWVDSGDDLQSMRQQINV